MKPFFALGVTLLLVPLFADVSGPAPAPAVTSALARVDDPPPDPTDCPFCGGNPELHRTRVQALLRLTALLFERAVP